MIGGELQVAQFAALNGASVAGGRVYDRVPPSPTFPYVTLGDEQVIDDGSECMDEWEVFSDIHVWDRPAAGSKLALKTVVAQVAPVLAAPLVVTGFRTVIGRLQGTRTFRDPDGLTEHAVLTFRYLIDPA